MAGKKLLSCLKKRDLLNTDKMDRAELVKFGDRYSQDGRLSDSIDFYQKAEHAEGLNQLSELCKAEGDYFLYLRITNILERSPSSEEWTQLGDTALAQGKLLFARSAYEQAGNAAKVTEVEKLLQLSVQESKSTEKVLH